MYRRLLEAVDGSLDNSRFVGEQGTAITSSDCLPTAIPIRAAQMGLPSGR